MGTEVKLKREAIERRIAELEGKMPDIQASKLITMIEPQILYGVTCDRCGETLINSNDNSAWYDRSTAEEEASEEDWHSVSSHHYCPNCYREDDDGNRTIKAPFPYYVQKINRFMNRIAKSYPCRIVEEDDHFALHGNTQDGKQLAPCDEEWVRSYAADKLLGIQMIDKGCANAEYIIRLRKE